HCASSVCTLSASSSIPIQRSLRISLTSSFDFRCSDETSGGFCCLRDIKTSSSFRCLLITECWDSCSARRKTVHEPQIQGLLVDCRPLHIQHQTPVAIL